jgi:hypothetical protein
MIVIADNKPILSKKPKMKKNTLLIALAMLGASSFTAISAPITAYNGTAFTIPGGAGGDLSIGRQFDVTGSGITIQSLGVFDFGNKGLLTSNVVRLFSITANGAGGGSPVAITGGSVTVAAGGSATASSFQFQSLAPIFLAAGKYSVIAYNMDIGGDVYGDNQPAGTGLPVAGNNITNIAYSAYQFSIVDPAYPNSGFGNNLASTSFQFDVGNTIPEPGTWALLAFGLTTVTVLRRRRA